MAAHAGEGTTISPASANTAQNSACLLGCVIGIAGLQGKTATTFLRRPKVNRAALFFQHGHHGLAGVRVEQVNQTGDE